MPKKRPSLHLWIRGYESTRKIYERKVKAGTFSEKQLEMLLKVLAGKELSFDEILGACAKKNSKIYNELLTVHREDNFFMLWCGQGTYFTAELAERKKIQSKIDRMMKVDARISKEKS